MLGFSVVQEEYVTIFSLSFRIPEASCYVAKLSNALSYKML